MEHQHVDRMHRLHRAWNTSDSVRAIVVSQEIHS